MKRTWIVLVIVALVGQVQAADLLIGGTWYEGHGGALYQDGYGGDMQLRLPVASNLDVGLSAGYGRYSLSDYQTKSKRHHRRTSYTEDGSLETTQLGLSGIYGVPIGPIRVEGELGVTYNITDADMHSVSSSRSRMSRSDIDLFNFWTGKAGLNLSAPIGGPSIVAGVGYQFTLDRRDLGSRINNIDGLYCKLGVMFPL